ncbi:unnamed protein product [Chrysodeixis includens]|uniref:FLYWCH-type domain-containing protein n=1 Tax=Chrysodeixis includens TaxID=689277 RepID=A0A9N8KST3_CHRIL|nr:unnamed protein product [Chrysodeixis includens]
MWHSSDIAEQLPLQLLSLGFSWRQEDLALRQVGLHELPCHTLHLGDWSAYFTKSRNGRPVLICGGYRYNQNKESNTPSAWWRCGKARICGCKASVTTYDTPVFTMTRFGKPAIQMGKYRFNRNNRSNGARSLWVCGRVSSGCRATITTFNDIIIKEKKEHNH